MAPSDSANSTRILLAAATGEAGASAALLELLGGKLHSLASAYLRRERGDHILQPTALVNEAWLRLIDSTAINSGDRNRFLGTAARAMRQVLVDFARRRDAQRRGGAGWQRVTLHSDLACPQMEQVNLVALDQVLSRFAEVDERAARVVELRFFAGLTVDEAADVLGVSRRTADNDWFVARAWLAQELQQEDLY